MASHGKIVNDKLARHTKIHIEIVKTAQAVLELRHEFYDSEIAWVILGEIAMKTTEVHLISDRIAEQLSKFVHALETLQSGHLLNHLIAVKAVNRVIAVIARASIRKEARLLAVQDPQFYYKYADFAIVLFERKLVINVTFPVTALPAEFEVYRNFQFQYLGIILPTLYMKFDLDMEGIMLAGLRDSTWLPLTRTDMSKLETDRPHTFESRVIRSDFVVHCIKALFDDDLIQIKRRCTYTIVKQQHKFSRRFFEIEAEQILSVPHFRLFAEVSGS